MTLSFRSFKAILLAIAACLASCAWPALGRAAECARGNLLAQARVIEGDVAATRLRLLSDRVIAREGSPWPDPRLLSIVHGQVSFDLGNVVPLQQLYVQLDADQAFELELSADGVAWTRLPVAASPSATGLMFRSFNLNDVPARYVKLRATADPPTLTLSELGVTCQREAKVRHGLLLDEPEPEPWESSWSARLTRALTGTPVISPNATLIFKFVLAALAALLVAFELARRKQLPAAVWALIGVPAVCAYLNFGAYRYPDFVHYHDVFHYFIGAKYFPELGYKDIYTCSAVAEAEAGFPQRVKLRTQRDLDTNYIQPGALALARGADCPQRFTAQRWADFRHDVAYFANSRSVPEWHRILKDHGFNASPTWIALARVLGARLPASVATIGQRRAFEGLACAFDPLLLLGSIAVVVWAFGARASALVAVVFACNPYSEFAWVGGAFLREAWLAALVVALCLLRKQRFAWGGACLAFSVLLQLLPVTALVLPVLAAMVSAWVTTRDAGARFSSRATAWLRSLRAQRALWRFVGGAALSLALLVPLSARLTGAPGVTRVWSAFAGNTAKHEATPAGNLIGLGMLLSFRPSTTVDVLLDTTATDPFARTRAAQSATRTRMRPAQIVIVALALGLAGYALRRPRPLWWTAALGLCLVPLGLDASCYYSAWLCAFVLIGRDDERLRLTVLLTLTSLLAIKLGVGQDGLQMACASAALVLATFSVLVLCVRERSSRHAKVTSADYQT